MLASRARVLWGDVLFWSSFPENRRPIRLLGYERPYLQIAFRSLLFRTGSGTADVMSVTVGATEVTGDQVALEGYQRMQDESQFG